MAATFETELKAEIEAFRAEIREREIRREKEREAEPHMFFAGLDAMSLDAGRIRALIAQRYEYARLLQRLADAERRIAELETARGRSR